LLQRKLRGRCRDGCCQPRRSRHAAFPHRAPSRHREGAPEPRRSPLHFALDPFADPLRENPHSARSFAGSHSNRGSDDPNQLTLFAS
jgi:hypothetical protein